MSEKTRLPGTIPGLLRRGSPVICTETFWRLGVDVEITEGMHGVVAVLDPLEIAWVGDNGLGYALLEAEPGDIALDLTDLTGWMHAVGWARVQRGCNEWAPRKDETDVLYDMCLRFAGERCGADHAE